MFIIAMFTNSDASSSVRLLALIVDIRLPRLGHPRVIHASDVKPVLECVELIVHRA